MRDDQFTRTKGGKRQPRNLKSKWTGRLASFMEAAATHNRAKSAEEIMAEYLLDEEGVPTSELLAEIRALLEGL